jgi:hypothetical protein
LHVYGALIVDGNEDLKYDEDRVVVVSDYWRRDLKGIKYGLLDAEEFEWIGDADAFLINSGKILCERQIPSLSRYLLRA